MFGIIEVNCTQFNFSLITSLSINDSLMRNSNSYSFSQYKVSICKQRKKL